MCRAEFVQLFIANVLDRTPICKSENYGLPQQAKGKFTAQDLCISSAQMVQIAYGMQSETSALRQEKIWHPGFVHPFNANGCFG
jgi:hypothetical protein